jgi:hypothetical protein
MAVGQDSPDNPVLGELPERVASIFRDTLLPQTGLTQEVDLDGNGTEEILLVSHVPFYPPSESTSPRLRFQTHLQVFELREGEGFPYSPVASHAVDGAVPRPAHVTVEDLGEGPEPEIVWLEQGPDAEGRYAEAILFAYRGGQQGLVEKARFAQPGGWVRIHDLDRDGLSEIIGFEQGPEGTVCPNLLFYFEGRWTTVAEAVRAHGSPDIPSFQIQNGLETTGRVTRSLLEVLKQGGDAPLEVTTPGG